MNHHPSRRDLELYIVEELGTSRASEVEAHVVACERCSAVLAREARVDVALGEVARELLAVAGPALSSHGQTPSRSKSGLAVVAAGAVSLAAAWMLFVTPVTRGATRTADVRASGGPSEHSADVSDATPAALDGSSLDPLDGG